MVNVFANCDRLTKAAMRSKMKQFLETMSDEDKLGQSSSISGILMYHKHYKTAKSISVYASTNNEVNTIQIIKDVLDSPYSGRRKKCYIPMILDRNKDLKTLQEDLPSTRMVMVRIYSLADFEQLPKNKYGIKEPLDLNIPDFLYASSNTQTILSTNLKLLNYNIGLNLPTNRRRQVANPKHGDLDLAIVPGLAFSHGGERLGHGKGYYDEFLNDWFAKANRPLRTIGICFDEQLCYVPLALSPHDYIVDEVRTGSRYIANTLKQQATTNISDEACNAVETTSDVSSIIRSENDTKQH